MTLPTPTVVPTPTVSPLARLRLTEPVRLYLYSAALVVIVGLNLAGFLSGEWTPYAESSAAVLLGVGAAGEAARASVYSPTSVVAAVRRAAQQ